MLKLCVGNGHQVITQLCRRMLQYYVKVATERMGYVLYRALVQVCMHGYQSASYQADTSPYIIDSSRIKWAWLQSLAVHDHSLVLKSGIKLAKLSITVV